MLLFNFSSMIIYALLATSAISLVSLVGVFTLSIREELLRKYIFLFVSLAVGALLGGAFLHLIPESYEAIESEAIVGALIISGLFLFFAFEKFLHWHHHEDDTAEHDHIHPVGTLILVSDALHNFIDGIVIGASFMVSIPVGIAATVAVMIHEIPQEIGDFAVLLHAGYTRSKALWYNFLSALTAVLGTVVVFVVGNTIEPITVWILPIAAGGFLYIAVADLIPELNKTHSGKHSIAQFAVIALGVALMYALTFLE